MFASYGSSSVFQIFLSSSEAQHVVNCLWRGDWIQRNNDNMDIDYVPYQLAESSSFWAHLNPDRMSVPRYQSTFKIVVWSIFLFGKFVWSSQSFRFDKRLLISLFAKCREPPRVIQLGEKLGWLRNCFICDGRCVFDRR